MIERERERERVSESEREIRALSLPEVPTYSHLIRKLACRDRKIRASLGVVPFHTSMLEEPIQTDMYSFLLFKCPNLYQNHVKATSCLAYFFSGMMLFYLILVQMLTALM